MYTLHMAKQLTVAPHLELDELERRYRAASDPVARSQWLMVWHLAQGKTAAVVAELVGYHVTHVRQFVATNGSSSASEFAHAAAVQPDNVQLEPQSVLSGRQNAG